MTKLISLLSASLLLSPVTIYAGSSSPSSGYSSGCNCDFSYRPRARRRVRRAPKFPDKNKWQVARVAPDTCRNVTPSVSKEVESKPVVFVKQQLHSSADCTPQLAAFVKNDQGNNFGLICREGALRPYLVLTGDQRAQRDVEGVLRVGSRKPVSLGLLNQTLSHGMNTWTVPSNDLTQPQSDKLIKSLRLGVKSTFAISFVNPAEDENARKYVFSLNGSDTQLGFVKKECDKTRIVLY